jgi:serine/threonine-protein kinase
MAESVDTILTGPPTLGPYVLGEMLGAGGMGEVWRAVDGRLARPVALKILTSRLCEDDVRARFMRESRAASALNHPHIVTVYEAGSHDGKPFLAMELIEGRTLATVMAEGLLAPERAIELIGQVLLGLSVAHDAGIVHRDIKPENLMLRNDGYVKILDFGLALLANRGLEPITHADTVLGTPYYMSPEQATGRTLDGRTDLFSTGVVLYEMLAGRRPFAGSNFAEFVTALMTAEPAPLNHVPEGLWHCVKRALDKDPDRRHASARDMLAELKQYATASLDLPKTDHRPSLLVLPFTSSSTDQDVAEGLMDELLGRLVRLQGVRVLARSTSIRFRGINVDVAAVGRELKVRYVVEGHIRRQGMRTRLSLGLIEAVSGTREWAERFDCELDDPFDLQEDLARRVCGALVAKLQARVPSAAGEDAPAANAQALYYEVCRSYRDFRPAMLLSVRDKLERLVDVDPGFARGHAMLARVLAEQSFWFHSEESTALLIRAQEEAEHALALDATCALAFASLGHIAWNGWCDTLTARNMFRHSLSLEPNNASTMGYLASMSTTLGYPLEGERLAREALALDPLHALNLCYLSYALTSQGRLGEGADAAERALRLDQHNPVVLMVVLLTDVVRGQVGDALRYCQWLERHSSPHPMFTAAVLVYRAFHDGLRYADVDDPTRLSISRSYLALRWVASICGMHGEVEECVRLLRRSWVLGLRNVPLMDQDAMLDPVRHDPRFVQLREEMLAAIERDREA